jgi:transcriptional regulator with XRE-family HTH domain
VGTLVPSQIRALRLKSEMPRQSDLAKAADMKQSRISMMETPGAANMTLDTLSAIAAALKVGLRVEFVPFSEMLAWENNFSQDQFNVKKIDNDLQFIKPSAQIPGYIQTNVNSSWITMDVLKALTDGYSQSTGGKLRIIPEPSETRKVFVRGYYNVIEANDLSAAVRPTPQPEYGDVQPWVIDKVRQSQFSEGKDL